MNSANSKNEVYQHLGKGFPKPQGMYDPANERDACGVGFICNMDGNRSHDIIHKSFELLCRLTHRGAKSADNRTGDGAGLQIQLPHEFFTKLSMEENFELPEFGQYGTGLVFLPKDEKARRFCIDKFNEVVAGENQPLLAWREVPVNRDVLGEIAAASEPHMSQVFIGRSNDITADRDFERVLYIIRKTAEKIIEDSDLDAEAKEAFYLPTLSSRIIVYKGLLQPQDFEPYFTDLLDPEVKTCLALVHQRYSTNTFPAWKLCQPFRFLCHNGEINTLRGNINWMNTRQHQFKNDFFGERIRSLFPVCIPGNSDSATLDNTLELLYHTGRDLPHAMMMMVPEAWQNHKTMADDRKAFYEYHSCLMEPWDGPALMPFTDGTFVGAILDRNGLRPARWLQTTDDQVIMASETGVVDIPPEKVARKGRLEPGRMFLINLKEGRIVEDEEIKTGMAARNPYREWLNRNMVNLDDLPVPSLPEDQEPFDLLDQQQLFGYTLEDLRIVMKPMAVTGIEALGSMGADIPLAVLSDRPQLLYNYFRQLFAQVTNPPLDGIREELVTSLIMNIGHERDLFQETPQHARLLKLHQPILTNDQLNKIRHLDQTDLKTKVLPIHYDAQSGSKGLEAALDTLFANASQAIDQGYSILILSDRGSGREKTPIPALLATAGLHHHLIREGKRTKCGIVVETGEAREVHHFATLIGYGAGAVNPYIAFATLDQMTDEGYLKVSDRKEMQKNYIKAVGKGLLKVMSKMGVSTLHSYRGAQIFEAIGLNSSVTEKYFCGTPSRIEGSDLEALAQEVRMRYDRAYPSMEIAEELDLEVGGVYQWRRRGEKHLLDPMAIAMLQQATKIHRPEDYKKFATMINDQNERLCTLRGLFRFNTNRKPVPIEEVEPWTEIVKRFKTGAMSYGSISKESHETLAIAMNRIGAKSNSGEGGEDVERFVPDQNGDSRCSAIKQVASGRFGVTSHYLVNSKEIQIKMAQGAKPGEGGQLPGVKVNHPIAKTRHSTPYVGLISPPPHHDIYSIEDLAQLIHDLKNANKYARINVKLVSEVGVGTVAAGVSKGKADVVLVSGWDGGTGASPETSLKHAGLPWELGIAETHQTLVLNDLRSRIVVECDGKLLTGRDVAIACLLGAEEFGFSSGPLVVMGCIMMRVCHLNTCPVGIATQNPELRKKFEGSPDSVVNYFHLVAEELREIMASLGFRTMNEMVGQSDALNMHKAIDHFKARNLDLSKILHKPAVPDSVGVYKQQDQDHELDAALDNVLIEKSRMALDHAEHVHLHERIANTNRTVGTMLSAEVSRHYGEEGLPEDTIMVDFHGHAGQSFAAFLANGITFRLEGDANDYFGKGCSGGKIITYPPRQSPFRPKENIIIGNVAFYGATSGEAYMRGIGGERFCVRNSGVHAVIEGIGDHGCEYMTGGRVVVIGPTGRNFAAGMSGGIAYVLDQDGDFAENRCNMEMVELEEVVDPGDMEELKDMLQNHLHYTDSAVAKEVLENWEATLPKFIKIMPTDYRLALERLAKEREEAQHAAHEQSVELAEKQG